MTQENIPTSPPVRMNLSSISACRATFGRIIRRYNEDRMTAERAKTLAYLLQGLLAFWKAETEYNLEERLSALEAAIGEQQEEAKDEQTATTHRAT